MKQTDTHQKLRQQLCHYAQRLNSSGLNSGSSGNLSIRVEQGLLITPSGVPYDQLQPSDIVEIDYSGRPVDNTSPFKASSEWHFHAALYQAKPEVRGITHAHPDNATALACTGRSIPAFHYMVASAGGNSIPLAPYALFGTEALAQNIVNTLAEFRGCLLANHGLVATGVSLDASFTLAIEIETLAKQYLLALAIGDVVLLSADEMRAVHEQFKGYGQSLGQGTAD